MELQYKSMNLILKLSLIKSLMIYKFIDIFSFLSE